MGLRAVFMNRADDGDTTSHPSLVEKRDALSGNSWDMGEEADVERWFLCSKDPRRYVRAIVDGGVLRAEKLVFIFFMSALWCYECALITSLFHFCGLLYALILVLAFLVFPLVE